MELSRLLRIAAQVAGTQVKREMQWRPVRSPTLQEVPEYRREDVPSGVYARDKHAATIKWKVPDLKAEQEAFKRAAKNLGFDVSDILLKVGRGKLCPLPPQIWSVLSNSDSWTIESIKEAKNRASLWDVDSQPILDAVATGQTVAAPIVLILDDGTPHLISGDDRLMVARAMDAEAKAYIVNMASTDN